MADEFIQSASAARAISILGEGALKSSAAELVKLALGLELVVGDGVPGDNLTAAARALTAAAGALSHADSESRSQAIVELLNTATALEATLGVEVDDLRGGASELAVACREHLKTAEDLEQVRPAAAALEEQGEERAARPPWWWLLLRGKGSVQRRRESGLRTSLLAEEDPPPPPQATGAKEITEELLREAWCTYVRVDILPRARRIQQLAVDVGVPHHHLDVALMGADNASADVAELSIAATVLEQEATALLRARRAPVAQLSEACRKHQQVAIVMEEVQRAAEQRARLGGNAAASVQNAPPPPPRPGPVQGDQRGADMQSYALCGWFSLVPYLAASTGELPKKLSAEDRWKIYLALSSWVTVVSTSILLSSFARSWFWNLLATITSRVGLCGVNVFAILFVYWILQINAPTALYWFLGASSALHFLFLIVACVNLTRVREDV